MNLYKIPNNTRPTTLGTSRQFSETKLSKTTRRPRRSSLKRSSLNRFVKLFLLAPTAVSANKCPLTGTCKDFITFDLKLNGAPMCKFYNDDTAGKWTIAISSFKDPQCAPDANSTHKQIIDNFFGNNLASCVNNTDCREFYNFCTTQNTNNIDNCDISFLDMTPAPSVQPSVSPTTKRPSPQPTTVNPIPQPTTANPIPQPTTANPTPQPTTANPTTATPTTATPSYEPTTSKPSYVPTSHPSDKPSPAPSTYTPTSYPTASSAPTSSAPTSPPSPATKPETPSPSTTPENNNQDSNPEEKDSTPNVAGISIHIITPVITGLAMLGVAIGLFLLPKPIRDNIRKTIFNMRDKISNQLIAALRNLCIKKLQLDDIV